MAVVAVIGVGRVGLAVVERLVAAGHPVRACDVRAEVAAQLPAGAEFVGDPLHAVSGADAVLTVLPGSPELRALMLADGLLARLRPGTVWIDLTSAAPDLAAELATAARECQVGYLDAPLGGGPDAVRARNAALYVGGDAAQLDRWRPLLGAFATRLEHVGPNGAGVLTKLLINALWFGQALATGEALLIARGADLDLARFAGALRGSAVASEFLDAYLPRLLAGDHVPSFGLDRCVEELDSLERLAGSLGLPAEMIALVARIHREALARFGPVDGELLGVAHLASAAGIPIRTA
jgi:3-hydroxyisobutyrate dehydrogenase-like beta-hydroxyacid dehydrogenase